MAKKAFAIGLMLVGTAFALGALLSWLDNMTANEPVGLAKWIFDIFQFLLSAAVTGLGAWLNFGKKDEKKEPTTTVSNIQYLRQK